MALYILFPNQLEFEKRKELLQNNASFLNASFLLVTNNDGVLANRRH